MTGHCLATVLHRSRRKTSSSSCTTHVRPLMVHDVLVVTAFIQQTPGLAFTRNVISTRRSRRAGVTGQPVGEDRSVQTFNPGRSSASAWRGGLHRFHHGRHARVHIVQRRSPWPGPRARSCPGTDHVVMGLTRNSDGRTVTGDACHRGQ